MDACDAVKYQLIDSARDKLIYDCFAVVTRSPGDHEIPLSYNLHGSETGQVRGR